jgi:hypothetical protein
VVSGPTPGPWTARESSLSRDGNLWFIEWDNEPASATARVAEVYRPPNARLIAAAPDLLAALAGLLKAFDEGIAGRNTERDHEPGWVMRSVELVRTLASAQAAIAKATGEAK